MIFVFVLLHLNVAITDWPLNFQGVGAVVGAISRNLGDLQDRQGSYLSIYDQPALPLQVSSYLNSIILV